MSPIWALARPLWPRLLAAGLLGACADLAGVALMATATWLLVTAAGQPPMTALTVAIVAVRAFAIGRGGLRYLERLAAHDAVLRMITSVRARAFGTLAASGAVRTGDALSRLVSDVDAVQDLVVRVALPAASAAGVACLTVGATALVSPAAALVLAAGLLVLGAVLPLLARRLAGRAARRLAPLRAEYAIATVDLVHGAADLDAFGARDAYAAQAAARAAELATVERRLARRAAVLDATATLVIGGTAALVLMTALADGVRGVLVGVLAVGTLAAGESGATLLAAARRHAEIAPPLARITALLPTADRHRVRADHELAEPAPPPTASADQPAAGPPPQPRELRADGVSVRYRSGGAPALAGVDLRVPVGGRVVVVGESGSGKSTLLGVLAGQITPDQGTVTWGGAPLPRPAYEFVGGLFADAAVFHTSVEENVTLGRPCTREELDDAARAAGLLEWIEEQPDGWRTLVGENGTALSGGQRQRLTLARALLQAPPVLLLDEPTEGLDPGHADEVLRSVLAYAGDRAVVLVTHRTAERDSAEFDQIVTLG